MTTRQVLRQTLRQRRAHNRGTAEHEYLSNACRKLWWIIIGRPVNTWPQE